MTNSLIRRDNISADQTTEHCHSLGPYAWHESFLTKNVYKSLVANTTINSVTAVFIIIFNALVIAVVIRKPQLRSSYTILLACLAGTDLMVGAFAQPLVIAADIKRIVGVGPYCALDCVMIFLLDLIGISSFNHLFLISIERYVAIKHPLRYLEIVTEKRIRIRILLAWALSLLASAPFIFKAWSENEEHEIFWNYHDIAHTILGCVMITMIIYTNAFIYSETCRQKKRIKNEQVSHQEAERLKKECKAGRTLIAILIVLVVSYSPYFALIVMSTYVRKKIGLAGLYAFSCWSTTFTTLASLLNPIIYCIRLTSLRKAILQMLHRRQVGISPDIVLS